HYAVTSETIGAADAATWRSSLISTLGQVDNADYFPVGSVGMATWTLAQTGNGLSNATAITGTSSIFNGMTLGNLPNLHLSEMVLSGPTANSFYYDFAHTDSGYTEDTAMGIMGLIAAHNANPSLYTSQI